MLYPVYVLKIKLGIPGRYKILERIIWGLTMGMNDYILKDVLLVPTDKATRYDLINGKWHKMY